MKTITKRKVKEINTNIQKKNETTRVSGSINQKVKKEKQRYNNHYHHHRQPILRSISEQVLTIKRLEISHVFQEFTIFYIVQVSSQFMLCIAIKINKI